MLKVWSICKSREAAGLGLCIAVLLHQHYAHRGTSLQTCEDQTSNSEVEQTARRVTIILCKSRQSCDGQVSPNHTSVA